MRIKKAPTVQQICRNVASQGSRAHATRQSKDGYNMPRGILLRIAGMLLASALVTGSSTDSKNATYFSGAFAQELPPKGDLIEGDVKPYGQLYVFEIRRGSGNKIIAGYDAQRGDKIRLLDFGLTDFNTVRGMMQQVGNDVQLRLPGRQIVWILKAQIRTLGPNTFQLELDRRGLIPTFADEFNEFSWYAEGLNDRPTGGGTWRTNFGYAPVQHLGSRTLGSNGELQVYSDRGFRGTASAPLGIEPFRIVNGTLEIVGDKAPESVTPFISNYEYTSGLITTQFSFSQLYGVFEMRARMPRGTGLWPVFWLLPEDRSWPPEIDIIEILGQEPTVLHTNAHSNATGVHTDAPDVIRVPDTSADFHLYAVDWQKDEIRWYFDGFEVARAPTPADMHKPMYVLVCLAIGGHWVGRPDESTHFPAVLTIDWIRAYRRATARR
jgi:beta-glucanase (GH16 family)